MQDCVPALLPTLIEPLLFPIQVFPKQARSCLAEKKCSFYKFKPGNWDGVAKHVDSMSVNP